MATFAELYCSHYRVAPERFKSVFFWRCLHRRAWPFVPLLRLLSPGYFTPDHDLVSDVGRLTRASALNDDLADFNSHPMNVGFLRRRLRIRISVRRLSREVHHLLPGRASETFYAEAGNAADAENPPPSPEQPGHSASS